MNETRRAVLDALCEAPHSGTELADSLDVSRAAVWKHVEALREAGVEIESGDDGYQVVSVPEYGAEAVACGLEAPFDVVYHERTGSTNDDARELAAEGRSDVVVLADEQTGGRGRLDREWASPSGGIWLSVLLRPDRPPAEVPLFTLAAAVATTRAAREAGVGAGIKWPNDVLVSERQRGNEGSSDERSESDGVLVRDGELGDESKLAGILTEVEGEADRVSWVVLGIGLNANVDADALPERATSLRAEVGDVERRVFVQRMLEAFEELRGDLDSVLDAWREHALTLGRRVRVETATETIEGTATAIEHPGALVVETDDGERRIHAGDCEHLRPAE